ncbi:hypothetical protein Q649_00422 [Bartonella quintana JK 73]|uniref:Uncharacterized protein n=1 Tax=Bartonella quintana JK 73 TaxID=1402976 RepID=W3TXZ8_BARQI|nr:hypothetical protein Q650_00413 [Bartonella quintana JK 73rel]ETS15484.1 hypothetical protein Q649_00422 [Bartonella quintana JK 73]KEC59498.1 hypothetical protein O93_00829 [Bartonella quintana JK 19]
MIVRLCILSLSVFDGKGVLAEDDDDYVCGLDQVSGFTAIPSAPT